MLAYVALQFRRWLRRPLGAGFLVAPLLMTGIFVFGDVAFSGGRASEPTRAGGFQGTVTVLVVILGALAVGNQLAAVIQEESRLCRSALLRIGDLDGARAVGSFVLFGCILSVAYGTLGFVGPILAGFLNGVTASSWIPYVQVTVLALSALIPLSILCGFLFPRQLGLLLVNGCALLGGVVVVSRDWGARYLWYLAILHAVSFLLLAFLWKWQSSRRW